MTATDIPFFVVTQNLPFASPLCDWQGGAREARDDRFQQVQTSDFGNASGREKQGSYRFLLVELDDAVMVLIGLVIISPIETQLGIPNVSIKSGNTLN